MWNNYGEINKKASGPNVVSSGDLSFSRGRMKTKVVFTALMGRTESLQEISFPLDHSDIDFVCFTDQADLQSQTWNIVQVDPRVAFDHTRSARFLKLMGHELLSHYDMWLWIDNRVKLTVAPDKIFEEDMRGHFLAMSPHDHRDSIREEFVAVLKFRKDHPFRVRSLWNFIDLTSPEILDEKPFNCTIILRKNTPEVSKFMEKWWEMIMLFSARDQLSLNYAMRETGITIHPLPFDVSGSMHHSYTPRNVLAKSRQKLPRFYPTVARQLLDLVIYNRVRSKIEPRIRGALNFSSRSDVVTKRRGREAQN